MGEQKPFDCPHGNGAYVGIGSKCVICYIEAEITALREENRKLRDLIKIEKWFAETKMHWETYDI